MDDNTYGLRRLSRGRHVLRGRRRGPKFPEELGESGAHLVENPVKRRRTDGPVDRADVEVRISVGLLHELCKRPFSWKGDADTVAAAGAVDHRLKFSDTLPERHHVGDVRLHLIRKIVDANGLMRSLRGQGDGIDLDKSVNSTVGGQVVDWSVFVATKFGCSPTAKLARAGTPAEHDEFAQNVRDGSPVKQVAFDLSEQRWRGGVRHPCRMPATPDIKARALGTWAR